MRRYRRTEASRYRAHERSGGRVDLADESDRAVELVSAQAARRPLVRAIAGLPDRDRDVLLLVAWADLTYEEVARALSIPIGTVRSRLSRARRKIRKALGGINPLEES